MPTLDSSIEIKAPLDKVFAYVSDVTTHPEWVKWSKEAEITSPGKVGVGATDAELMQIGPRKQQVEAIVTEYQPEELFTRRHTRGLEMRDSISFSATPDGSKVDWTIEYTPPMGGLGKLMDFLFTSTLFIQLQEDSLTNLKERLEGAR